MAIINKRTAKIGISAECQVHWYHSSLRALCSIAKGKKPDLAIDFHNDDGGPLIFIPPANADSTLYVDHMRTLEKLLRKDTWFTERAVYRNPGGGISQRYGIDWFVYELNAHWVKGLQKRPLGEDWVLLGEQLCGVFNDYFKSIE